MSCVQCDKRLENLTSHKECRCRHLANIKVHHSTKNIAIALWNTDITIFTLMG